jgi:hypothetical protein
MELFVPMAPVLHAVLRSGAAVLGGYALSACWVAISATRWPVLWGVSRSEGVVLSAMLGFVVYLLVLLWAFSARRLTRVLAVTTLLPAAGWAWISWA